jgi:hypothetical protein
MRPGRPASGCGCTRPGLAWILRWTSPTLGGSTDPARVCGAVLLSGVSAEVHLGCFLGVCSVYVIFQLFAL